MSASSQALCFETPQLELEPLTGALRIQVYRSCWYEHKFSNMF
jgi:hypothetical protein